MSFSPVAAAWRAKVSVARNGLGRAWRQSALRTCCIALVAAGLATGTYVLFVRAFAFLHGLEVVGPLLVSRLLALFFFMLFVMLVLSNALVGYQTLYRSREADFWAVAPVPARTTFDARSLEIAAIASWAFLVLGTPLLLAFAVGTRASWLFTAMVPAVLVLFCVIAHSVGAIAVIGLVRLFPGLDLKRLVVLVVAALAPVAYALVKAFRVGPVPADADGSEVLVRALEGLGRTQYPYLPGYWAARALWHAGAGEGRDALFFAWSLAITAAFFLLLAREAAGAWLVPGYQLLRGTGLGRPVLSRRRGRRGRPARGPLRALASKDLTLFVREAAQWSQVGLVALLAAVYVLNLRSLPDLSRFALWGNVAAYLNLGVLLLLVATLTTRFAFPLVSMEGRRAWIVLLAPLPRTAILRQKMLLAVPVAIAFGEAAAFVSTRVLATPPHVRLVSHAAVAVVAVGLAGLAVGLGALFPNFREDNPARIVSGFGGTLSFLLGLGVVAVTTLLLGAPSVLEALGRIDAATRASAEIVAMVLALALAIVAAGVPLALGARRLRALEL